MKRLRVIIASPLGREGKGGMDRIADLIVSHVEAHPEWGIDVSYLTTKGGLSKLRGAFVFAAAIARLVGAGLMGRADVLHINLAAYGSVYRKAILAEIARFFGIPYVVHIHSGRFGDFWIGASRPVAGLVNRLLSRSRHIIVLGRGYEELVLSHLPSVKDKLSVVPNATAARVSKPRTSNPGEPKQITYLGLIAAKKGTPELIASLHRLAGRSDWTATMAGHGDVEDARLDARNRGIAERVGMPGWIGAADVDDLLRRTDIFVLPSYSEGLSMAVLEAFASGTAVIATPVNAMTEVIEHGRNGLLVPPGDVDALCEALTLLLDDHDLRRRLATAALADHAERYDIGPYVSRIVAIWRSAIA